MTYLRNWSDWRSKWRLWVDYIGPNGDWCRRELIDKAILTLLGKINGRRILDVGCGEGRLVRILAAKGAKVAGIDIVPEFIDLARAVAENRLPPDAQELWPWLSRTHKPSRAGVQLFRVADIAHLPSEFSAVFDAAVCCCSLNHISNLSKAVVALRCVLKPKGACVVVLPSPYNVLPCGKLGRRRFPIASGKFLERISPKLTITNVYRTFPEIVNAFAEQGMCLDRADEPLLKPAARKKWATAISALRRTRQLPDPAKSPWFLMMRFRKVAI